MSRIRDLAKILTASTDMATDAEVTSSIASHAAAADPHTGYLKELEFAAAGKNAVINGGFDIWQRGTSITGGAGGRYIADRWFMFAGGQITATRQLVSDSANVPGLQYCARIQRNSGSSDATNFSTCQSFETVNSVPLAGKTVTLSYYARRGANYSASGNALGVLVATGTGTDENKLSAGYTGNIDALNTTVALTTSWQRFTHTMTLSSTTNEIAVFFAFTPTGTAGANDWYEVTGVQLEVGSTATPFSRAGGTLQGELVSCKRYFERNIATSTQGYTPFATGFFNFATAANYAYKYEVEKRGQPTITFGPSTNQFMASYKGNAGSGASTITAANISRHGCYITLVPSGTPFTPGEATVLQDGGSAVAYIDVAAEI